jgi:hypothetical protein
MRNNADVDAIHGGHEWRRATAAKLVADLIHVREALRTARRALTDRTSRAAARDHSRRRPQVASRRAHYHQTQ